MILKFLKIGAEPVTLVYPIPLVSFLGFCLTKNFIGFFASYLFGMFFFTAINLWNHINDAEDDLRAGRENAEFLIENRFSATLFVLLCYFLAFLVVITFSSNKAIAIDSFLISALITWIYSDKLFVGRFIRRFKEDYRTEILTYFLVTVFGPLLFWTFFCELNEGGLYFTALISSLYLSGFFLKDIKDITADSEAGYRTLAVVASPGNLLKMSAVFFTLAFAIIALASISGAFPKYSILTLLMLPILLYVLVHFHNNGWRVSEKIAGEVRIYVNCYPACLVLLSLLLLF